MLKFGAMLLFSMMILQARGQDTLDLTNVVSADIQRKDVGSNIRIIVTLNLTAGQKYVTDFYLNDDADKFQNGTNQERVALRKKYIRQAVKNYLASLASTPVEVDKGSATVPKSNFSQSGDTNP